MMSTGWGRREGEREVAAALCKHAVQQQPSRVDFRAGTLSPFKRVSAHTFVCDCSSHPAPAHTNTQNTHQLPQHCTGCEAPYIDPKTQLRYASAEAFRIARSLTEDEVQARLAIRNAQSVLK